jgi:hypothetical protein
MALTSRANVNYPIEACPLVSFGAKSAQKLEQPQPFLTIFPLECSGQLAYYLGQPNTSLAKERGQMCQQNNVPPSTTFHLVEDLIRLYVGLLGPHPQHALGVGLHVYPIVTFQYSSTTLYQFPHHIR